jgi:hypothetical protein
MRNCGTRQVVAVAGIDDTLAEMDSTVVVQTAEEVLAGWDTAVVVEKSADAVVDEVLDSLVKARRLLELVDVTSLEEAQNQQRQIG